MLESVIILLLNGHVRPAMVKTAGCHSGHPDGSLHPPLVSGPHHSMQMIKHGTRNTLLVFLKQFRIGQSDRLGACSETGLAHEEVLLNSVEVAHLPS